MRISRFLIAALALATLTACGGGGGGGGGSVAVFMATSNNRLVKFELDSTSDIDLDVAITGLAGGEEIVGMDFRASNGLLYALGSTGQLYTINTTTGAATAVGTGIEVSTVGSADFGFDINNVVDRIRVVTNTDLNFRINPNTGGVVDGDAVTPGIQPDIAINPASDLAAAAYTPVSGGATTLFAIDSTSDSLVRIGDVGGTPLSPNSGIRTVIGPLGTAVVGDTAFDISEDNVAVMATRVGANTTNVFTVDLADGGATFVGLVGGNFEVNAMAIDD